MTFQTLAALTSSVSTLDGVVPVLQYATPTTGQTVTVGANKYTRLLINPAGTLLALTVALPGSPANGDIVQLGASQIVTGLTISGGTVIGALTSLAVASFATYCFSFTASKWFRIG